ncbi:MAG: FHA domain-containing protein [Ilumatobacteraceae bacterium]
MTGATTLLAPGSGLVARRPGALLYVTEHDTTLIEQFAASPQGGELQAVASTTVASGFAVGPFVCLSWSSASGASAVRVMAFGDVAVETDQPSLPMLSGAGSRTWVEHTLVLDGPAVIEVNGDAGDADAATDLVAGVALAGGFHLELAVPATAPAPGTTEPRVPAPAATEPMPAPSPPNDEPVVVADPTTAVARIDGPAAPTGPPAPQAPVPASGGAVVVDLPIDADDLDVTLPPPASGALVPDVVGSATGEGRGSLVDAKLCGNGHPNPPTAATCGVCGAFLAPGTAAIVHVPRPTLGRLRVDVGEVVELDQELLIGRNPDRDTDEDRRSLRRVRLGGEKVSRSHVEVRFQGWEIFVADCGSTNGTFVVPHPGGQVAALEPGRLQMIEPGATVYFGSRSFTLLGRDGAK